MIQELNISVMVDNCLEGMQAGFTIIGKDLGDMGQWVLRVASIAVHSARDDEQRFYSFITKYSGMEPVRCL